jgi:hypothetical protein
MLLPNSGLQDYYFSNTTSAYFSVLPLVLLSCRGLKYCSRDSLPFTLIFQLRGLDLSTRYRKGYLSSPFNHMLPFKLSKTEIHLSYVRIQFCITGNEICSITKTNQLTVFREIAIVEYESYP